VAGSGEASPVMQLQVPPAEEYFVGKVVFNSLSFFLMIMVIFFLLLP